MKKLKHILSSVLGRAMTASCLFCTIFCVILEMTELWAADTAAPVADVESYDVGSSVFQKIADLEQEKVLMTLEKEKMQLQLDLDRLTAEKARLVREEEDAERRTAEQAAEIEAQKAAIEEERKKLEDEKRRMAEDAAKMAEKAEAAANAKNTEPSSAEPVQQKGLATAITDFQESNAAKPLADKYFLVDIVGAGNQLVATVEELGNGKQKKLSVGKTIEGYSVRSISIDDGVEFEKDGESFTIGVGQFGVAE